MGNNFRDYFGPPQQTQIVLEIWPIWYAAHFVMIENAELEYVLKHRAHSMLSIKLVFSEKHMIFYLFKQEFQLLNDLIIYLLQNMARITFKFVFETKIPTAISIA